MCSYNTHFILNIFHILSFVQVVLDLIRIMKWTLLFKAGYASSHRRRQDGQPDGAILLQRQVDADCLQRRVGKERGDSYIYLNSNIKSSHISLSRIWEI